MVSASAQLADDGGPALFVSDALEDLVELFAGEAPVAAEEPTPPGIAVPATAADLALAACARFSIACGDFCTAFANDFTAAGAALAPIF